MKRFLLIFLWLVVIIHFLKDITQDLLHIPTFLDSFGNITENLSWLPEWGQEVYLYGLGGLSLIAEVVLIYTIPFVVFNKSTALKCRLIKYSLLYLVAFFITALLLDPRSVFTQGI